MTSIINRVTDFFFPDRAKRNVFLLFFSLFFFKFLWFDFSWCTVSTFRPFSYIETYLLAAISAMVLTLPFVIFGMKKTTFFLSVALGFLLLSNLLYFRTYFTAIPLSSYGLLGNLLDYTGSVFSSLHWTDALFPLSTAVAMVLYRKFHIPKEKSNTAALRYFLLIILLIFIALFISFIKGGFKKNYESLQDASTHTCGPVIYTVFGSVYFDYIRDREVYTPEKGEKIKMWLDSDALRKQRPDSMVTRTNCIIILLESFESWVLERSVENQEITPFLNALLKDSTTLYAKNVLSQVKGGRSIDAQLMFNTGLLPINTGTYSLKYPNSRYPSLEKAMKEKYAGQARSFILTADKPVTWNQNVIASSFGFDTLLSRKDFVQDETVGPHYHHQLGDVSLLRQCAAKITNGVTWTGGANFVQIVTYSGHCPFTLPEKLKELSFPEAYTQKLRDYMTVARYTDRAIGNFIKEIRNNPLYDNTLIVLAGDHEGLMEMRSDWCSSEKGNGLVSPNPFVPLIIVNTPPPLRSLLIDSGVADSTAACIRCDKVMGQIDIYPTLIDLLGLSEYEWKGLGTSILNPVKPAVAIDPHCRIYGDTANVSPAEIQHLKEAWAVSDAIIKYDFFSLFNASSR